MADKPSDANTGVRGCKCNCNCQCTGGAFSDNGRIKPSIDQLIVSVEALQKELLRVRPNDGNYGMYFFFSMSHSSLPLPYYPFGHVTSIDDVIIFI